MLFRRKVWAGAVFAVLFLMLASQTIQRKYFLSQAPPLSQTTPPGGAPSDSPTTSQPQTAVQPGPGSSGESQDQGLGLGKADLRLSLPPGGPCGCAEGCVSDTSRSPWFSEHFDPHQRPVLNNTDKMDPEARSWWLGLQRSSDKPTLEEVMSQLFQVIPPPSLDIRPRPSRCHSCAVVGNSGNLHQSGHGEIINSHTSVIRMNRAVTKGFEEDVGNRTTHHFLYPESAVDVVGGASLVLLPFKIRDLQWLASALSTGHITMTYMKVKDRITADVQKVLVVNPEFLMYCHEHWTERHGRYPSTGLVALIFALHTCDQVSVFGYGADQKGNWHHYWEKNLNAGAFRKTGVHSAEYENHIIQQLAKEKKISLYL